MAESFIKPEYKKLYTRAAKLVNNRKVNAQNVIYLAGIVMEIVEKEKSLTGKQKKILVVNILKEVVRLTDTIEEDEKGLLYLTIDNVVPGAIDLIVAGANGSLNLNMADIKGCSCFKKQPVQQTKAREILDKKVKPMK